MLVLITVTALVLPFQSWRLRYSVSATVTVKRVLVLPFRSRCLRYTGVTVIVLP